METVIGTCHRCGEEKELGACPYGEEIHDDDEACCCSECAPECGWDV